jgi:hypothetical protein
MWAVFDARDADRCKLGWVDWKDRTYDGPSSWTGPEGRRAALNAWVQKICARFARLTRPSPRATRQRRSYSVISSV